MSSDDHTPAPRDPAVSDPGQAPRLHGQTSGGSPAPQPAAPVMLAPPPVKPFRRGFGLGAGAGLGAGLIVLVLAVVGSLVCAVIFAAVSSAASQANGPKVTGLRTVWGSETASKAQTMLAVPISGPIMAEGGDGFSLTTSTYGYEVANTLDKLTADDAAGVVLLIDTPGGTINGSRAIADAIDRYRQRTGKKVVAYVQGMSASGGMYAMAGADKIIADHGSLIGSIGIIFGPFTQYKDVVGTSGSIIESGVTTKGGITQEYLSQGKGKDFGNPYRPMTAQERAVFSAGLANEYDAFVQWVSTKRGIPAATITNDLGAYVFDAKTAIQHKLIDSELGRDEAFKDAARLMGIDPAAARLAQRQAPTALEQLLGAEARVYGYQGERPANRPATSVICTGTPQPLMWHGPVTAVCG